MLEDITFKLARLADVESIALMSRDLIEFGLGWSWTPARVTREVRCRDSLVLTARNQQNLIGFAIMHFQDECAHLNLLAVKPSNQRAGIGRHLVRWLEESALVAGISSVHLEVRAKNHGARVFYQSIGYFEVAFIPGYYRNREPAIRMAHTLRLGRWSDLNPNSFFVK